MSNEIAIGYTRLSQRSDRSLNRQEENIRDLVNEHDLELREILDEGERASGFDGNREQYQRVRELVRSGQIDAVLVDSKSRLARDWDEMMRFVLDVREHDVDIITAQSGEFPISEPTHAAIELVKAAAEHEAQQENIEKSIEETRERIERGFDHGMPPFGLQFNCCGDYWIPDEDEWPRVERAFEMRYNEDGTIDASLVDIANEIGLSVASVHRLFTGNRMETYETAVTRADGYTFEWGEVVHD